MRKSLKILLAMTIVGSLFAVGFAGNAAADRGGDSQENFQWASSHVDQEQYVAQGNFNHQDDNYAVSAAGNLGSGEAESGDAYAIQASYQSNDNSQSAWSNAENENEQEWED
ncbi:hypothetical protein [Haladaptatus sp. CMAA 1911]|uniref:hypothetical protein n=1 Tax=unclassified Haladaptatus TaxID=2622732 RepID=UPI0037540B32